MWREKIKANIERNDRERAGSKLGPGGFHD
jgi:hypothetical protein